MSNRPDARGPLSPGLPQQPHAKKPKIQEVHDHQPSPKVLEEGPAPIPINVMQNLGASLGISHEKLRVEQLMAEPKQSQDKSVANDK